MRKRRKIETIIVIILILLLFLSAFTILNKHKIKNSNLLNKSNINEENKQSVESVNKETLNGETNGKTSSLLALIEAEDICGDTWLETMNASVHELKISLSSLEKDSYEYEMYFELIENLENFNSLQQEDEEKINQAIVATKNSIEKILEFRGETYE